jgi:UDP-N-acetyl-D-glucosamine dehydrogenase
MSSVELDDRTIADADCVVILTDHTCLPFGRVLRMAKAVVDTRYVLCHSNTARVIRL